MTVVARRILRIPKISDDRSSRGLEFPMRLSCLEPSEPSSGGSTPQRIIHVVFPVRISNEICEATHSTGLEQTLSIPLLECNRKTSMPRIQNAVIELSEE